MSRSGSGKILMGNNFGEVGMPFTNTRKHRNKFWNAIYYFYSGFNKAEIVGMTQTTLQMTSPTFLQRIQRTYSIKN